MSLWKRIRNRLAAAALGGAAWLVPRLSRSTCVRLANFIGEVCARLDRRDRRVALDNLRCALGDALTYEQREDIVRANYRNFARTMIDLLWAPALARPENRHWLRIHFFPGHEELLAKRGAVMLSPHFGNWEWGSLSTPWAGHPCIAVTETFKNAGIAALFRRLRQTSGQTIIAQEHSMLRMLRTVKRGGCTALLTDLTVRPSQASAVITAFGLEMCVSVLHAVLVQRADALIVPALCTPDADGGATVRYFPPLALPEGASLREIAQACWDYFEPHIRAQPGLWLWPYKHFRYKPRDAARDYPAYANESGAFEKLRRAK